MNAELQIKVDNQFFSKTGDDKDRVDKTNNLNSQEGILNNSNLKYTDNESSITTKETYISDEPGFPKNTLGGSEELNKMDNNDLIMKLIEKVEQSNQQIKIDLNESEKRVTEDRRESEKRIDNQRQLSEERIEKKFIETMESIRGMSDKIDTKNDKLETKIDGSTKWIMTLCITTIVGIATMIFAAIAIYPK